MRQASGISERGPVRDHDHEYFRLRPWIETAARQMVCESCDDVIDPGQEIIAYRDQGAMHLECFDAEVDDTEPSEEVSLPAEINQKWDDIGNGYAVELTATHDAVAGRYVIHRLVVEAAGVTGEGLRHVAVAGLLRDAVAAQIGDSILAPDTNLHDAAKSGPTPETLRRVAAEYRLALLLGDAPTQHVADKFRIARSTAGRWVTRARDRGYLKVADPRGHLHEGGC